MIVPLEKGSATPSPASHYRIRRTMFDSCYRLVKSIKQNFPPNPGFEGHEKAQVVDV